MAVFVPRNFEEEALKSTEVPTVEPDPVHVMDLIFIRHGEQVTDKNLTKREDRLSEEGKERAITFAQQLKSDHIVGYCGKTERAKEYLRLILENSPPTSDRRINLQPALNALDSNVGREIYEKKRQAQIEELAFLVNKYQQSVRKLQKGIRSSILFVTHTHVPEGLLEEILGAPANSLLFDPAAVSGIFGPGDYWTLQTKVFADGGQKSSIMLRNKEYPINDTEMNRLVENHVNRSVTSLQFSLDRQTPTLNSVAGSEKYKTEAHKRFMFGEYVRFLAEDSDDLAKQLNDKESGTLSRQAAKFAGFLKQKLETFLALPYPCGETKDQATANLGIIESFIVKVLRKVGGKALPGRDKGLLATQELSDEGKFIEILENGFDEKDKLEIQLSKNRENKATIIAVFSKKVEATGKSFHFEKEISAQVIDEIISECLVIS